MKHAHLFGAGTFFGLPFQPQPDDLILAADGGYNVCKEAGLTPHLLIGDFDSMDAPTDFSHIVQVPVEKDDTDGMLTVKEALAQGCHTLHLHAMTGGKRLDHTLSTFQALLYIRRHGGHGYAYDDHFVYTAIENETFSIEKTVEWGLVSLFPLDGTAQCITLTGLQYPLENGSLAPGIPLGVSNHILADVATITVKQGALLVGWEIG